MPFSARLTARLAAALFIAVTLQAFAQPWPTKPIQLIVPYPPGGSTDLVSRALALRLGQTLGQPVVVENKPGATGAIAYDLVAKAKPDGYTLVTAGDTITILPFVSATKLTFDPITSFTPIAKLSTQPFVLAVHASVPVRTFREFLAYAKGAKEPLFYATSGAGTSQHLSGELIKKIAGFDMTHVAYKGGGQAIVDFQTGQVPVAVLGSSTVIPLAQQGKVRILAVTSKTRSPLLPGVPTLAESGLKDFDTAQWIGIVGPAGMPKAVVERLNADIRKALAYPATEGALGHAGLTPSPSSPEELGRTMRDGSALWKEVTKGLPALQAN
jgi:tripartite-type tricarboxylate transporter receptor subunit TctC